MHKIKTDTLQMKLIKGEETNEQSDEEKQVIINMLIRSMCSWYVRRDSKYYSLDNLSRRLSKDDVQRACIFRFKEEYPDVEIDSDMLKEVFRTSIETKHSMVGASIPVWDSGLVCAASNDDTVLWKNGSVAVNTWKRPAYRSVVAKDGKYEVATEFLDAFFTRKKEQRKFLDWLAWCLQNEGDKPAWAPFFYSSTKGSGKSTLSKLVGRLFGEENTVTLNGVEKLTSRFNTTVLTSKLVILEEVSLKTESPQSNAMKTFVTEKEATVELKGQEAESVEQLCCFLLTTNHLPTWIEKDERRYYLIDIDHDGHSSGPKSKEFAGICARLHLFLENDNNVASFYAALMHRRLTKGFSAKTLNITEDATPLMEQIQGASEGTVRGQLEELLDDRGQFAIPESDVVKIVTDDLGASLSTTRHLMSDLGWLKKKVKWDGKNSARAVWIKKGYNVENGMIYGPDSYEQELAKHFEEPSIRDRMAAHWETFETATGIDPDEKVY